MVPEEERLAIEMSAKRFRVKVQKAVRGGRRAGAHAVQGAYRVIYGLHVFASFISVDFRSSRDLEPWRSDGPGSRKAFSECGDGSSAEAAGQRSRARPARRCRRPRSESSSDRSRAD